MGDPTAEIAVSVLLTKEEYMQFSAVLGRAMRARRLPLLTGCGALLCVTAVAGLFFGSLIGLTSGAALCLLLAGVFLLCYDGLIAPAADKAAAARDYEEKDELRMCNVYRISDTSVFIQNARCEGTLPLAAVTHWQQAGDWFAIFWGIECSVLLPKRLLSEEEEACIEQRLRTAQQARH